MINPIFTKTKREKELEQLLTKAIRLCDSCLKEWGKSLILGVIMAMGYLFFGAIIGILIGVNLK